MRKFIKYVAVMLAMLIASAIMLDFVYTLIYEHSKTVRTKLQFVRGFKNEKFDYIVCGSSRVNNSLSPKIIEALTGKKGLNLAIQGSEVNEILMIIKGATKDNSVDKVFVNVDYNWNNDQPMPTPMVTFMPYVREPLFRDNYLRFGLKYNLYYYLPFYRYLCFEPRMGFREVFNMVIGRGAIHSDGMDSSGFTALHAKNRYHENKLKNYILNDQMNNGYAELIELCEEKGIEIYFLTTPVYESTVNNDLLNKYLPNYKDFSQSITNKSMFSDAIHLNVDGAEYFTRMFCEYYFLKPNDQITNNIQ